MKKIYITLIAFFVSAVGCFAGADQFPSTGDEMLAGAKMWKVMTDHKCSDAVCSHFTLQDAVKATAVFDYLKGYVYGIRITQAATKKRAFIFPPDGLDCTTQMEPLIEFLEKNPEAKAKPVSIGLYLFLKTRLPPGERDE
jgi:hypothetical protein